MSKFADGYFLSRIAKMMTIIKFSIPTSRLDKYKSRDLRRESFETIFSKLELVRVLDKSYRICRCQMSKFTYHLAWASLSSRFAVHFHGHHLRSETWNHRFKLSYTCLFAVRLENFRKSIIRAPSRNINL